MAHDYISTACLHGLHNSCRKTCKFCDSPCQCPQHNEGETSPPNSQVDQARSIARELLEFCFGGTKSPALFRRIQNDPNLFWLRGEEIPPGQWHANVEDGQ